MPPCVLLSRGWSGPVAAEELIHVDTEPEWADTATFLEHYGPEPLSHSANCVVVAGERGGEATLAACVVLSGARVDVNGVVRRQLDARKASFAPMEAATGETGVEYGGITPIGPPAAWPLLIDAAVADLPHVLVGSGSRRGKLIVPGEVFVPSKVFAGLPGAVVVEGLGVAA